MYPVRLRMGLPVRMVGKGAGCKSGHGEAFWSERDQEVDPLDLGRVHSPTAPSCYENGAQPGKAWSGREHAAKWNPAPRRRRRLRALESDVTSGFWVNRVHSCICTDSGGSDSGGANVGRASGAAYRAGATVPELAAEVGALSAQGESADWQDHRARHTEHSDPFPGGQARPEPDAENQHAPQPGKQEIRQQRPTGPARRERRARAGSTPRCHACLWTGCRHPPEP